MLGAPIAGLIAEVLAVSGASYDEGAQLFRVIRADRVALLAQVPPVDVGAARALISVAFEVPGQADPIELTLLRVHDAGVVDPRTRALPLRIDVDNQGRHLLVGQAGTAVLRTGSARRLPAVPVDAVLTEGGRPYVFVQLGGERFARRQVDVASSEAGMVAILAGVRSGERVVTRGAYDVQLASASRGLAAEGHVH
jgi:hypothetical protein